MPTLDKTTLRLPADLLKKAKHLAIERGCTLQDIVTAALAEYVKKGGR